MHLMFLDLLNELVGLLFSVDVTVNIVEECKKMLACNDPHIPLFTGRYINKLVECKFPIVFKNLLLPFMSWFDHSILKHLVLTTSPSSEGEVLLNRFASLIDYNQQPTMPSPSELVMPSDVSDYTLVATKCDMNYQEFTVGQVIKFKKSLTIKLGITEHAIQLVAVHVDNSVLYWMIPESVAQVISGQIDQHHFQLKQSGIIASAILLKQSLFDEQRKDRMKMSLFSHLSFSDLVWLLILVIYTCTYTCTYSMCIQLYRTIYV